MSDNAPAEREPHLRDYLRVLSRRRWPALAVLALALAAAALRAHLAPPVYRATTRILIEKTEVQNLGVVNPLYASWDPEFQRTQVQIIKSSATAERAAKALVADERFRAAAGPAQAGAPGAADALARTIRAGVAATPEKESKIVTVHFLSTEPALAALIVNAVVRAYVDQLFEMKASYSRYAIEWMTGKAREEGARLEKSERELQSFMRANDILAMESRAAGVPLGLSELSLELTKAETSRRELEAVHQNLKAVADDPDKAETIAVVERDAAYAAVKAQLLRAGQNEAELARKYGRKHPAMVAARQEIETLERKRKAEVRRVLLSVKNEMELAVAREADLRRRLTSGRSEAVAANEKFVRYEELKRAVESNRQLYDTLMARAKEESLTQQLQGVQVWTLEPATLPEAPDGPRAARTVLIGLLLGLAGGIGMAFFAEYLDNTVRSAEDLELKAGAPVLGVIPPLRGRGRTIERAMLDEPRQAAAESYRALRTSVLLATDDGPPRTLLVTSTAPEEGKTATAVNLAVGIASSGYSVLLVDADMRKPRIGGIFDLPGEHGLSTVLAAGETPAFADVGVPNLSVLPAGPVPPNPSELLGSKRMETLLRELRERFDIVVLDSPPFLTVADSLVIARKVEGLLLVVRAERSTYNGVRRGVKALRDVGARPLGLVLNAYDESRSGAYYYYHQHYYAEPDKEVDRRRAEA